MPTEEEDTQSEVTVFVNLLDRERVWKLKRGSEWNSFKERVGEIADDVKWSAIFHGQSWEDDSRTPEKNTRITVNLDLPGGEPVRRFPSTHVMVRIDSRDPFPITLIRGDE
jgi:hypothetical protein